MEPKENQNDLAIIQAKVKCGKSQFNKFGNYKYRNAEDILEAAKPVVNAMGYFIVLNDEVVEVGGRVYLKATATLTNGDRVYSTTAYAREEETKKGMDASQITGAASSYARKYALNGLLALDDTKDADHDKKESLTDALLEKAVERIKKGEKGVMTKVLERFEVTEDQRKALAQAALAQAIR